MGEWQWKNRDYLKQSFIDALIEIGVTEERLFVRTFGDPKLIDVLNCHFRFNEKWMVVHIRQIFGLNRYYYDCDCVQHGVGVKTRCNDTETIVKHLVVKLRAITGLPWEPISE
jgi:hypothetical protein